MFFYFIAVFLIIITSHGQYYCCSSSSSDLQTGYSFSLPVPAMDSVDNLFTGGRAFIMEAGGQQTPDFRVAVSVEQEEEEEEDIEDNYKKKMKNRKKLFSCSLDVFLGEVRVWSSGHSFRFYALGECVVELTNEGDLLLKGQNQTVGWKTGTSGQGVQRLQLLRNGNLVLVDTLNQIKWQSFNFPTDTMLWSQTLNVATRLTSTFPAPTTTTTNRFSFSFDIEPQKIALYLINSAANYSNSNSKYAFWEYKPSNNRNLTFIKVSRQGLDIFDQSGKKISRIQSHRRLEEPIRFLALDNKTGSLGLYYYSAIDGNFKAAFRVPNSTCDLPLACQPYGICTLTNVCTSSFINSNNNYYYKAIRRSTSCDAATRDVEMVDLRRNVWSVITGIPVDHGNLSSTKDRCAHTCINNCKCASALYDPTSRGSCFLYEFVRGLKELPIGSSPNFISYMVKVPKAGVVGKSSTGLKGWILALVAATDALVMLLVFLGIVYYCVISKRRRSYSHQTN